MTASVLPGPLAVKGRNCWRRVPADRVALLIDAQAYFSALKATLLRARRSILLLGWDLDSRTELDRSPGAYPPNTLAEVLDEALRRRRELRAHVLIWDTALIYSWDREFLTARKLRRLMPRRLDIRLDDNHPLGACHHQKIVVVDDAVAFVGGFDVTSGRWDSRAHHAADERRSDPGVPAYPPFHDVMLMLSGSAAAALGDLARDRWRRATGQRLRPPEGAFDPWPPQVTPCLRDVTAAIARTAPAWEGEAEVREVERLYLDMIAAARRFIYFENQYFASRGISRALLWRLQEAAPPDVLVVSCEEPVAILERTAMGAGRARHYARLARADRAGRLRLFHPVVPDGPDGTRAVKVHTKLAIVDDTLLRVGSANLNNRSMGLDSECDVLIEALGDPKVEAAIRRLRCELLGEHLGAAPEAVERATADGLIAGVERLRGNDRSLVPVVTETPDAWSDWAAMSDLFDPDRPLESVLRDESPADPGRCDGIDRRAVALAALLLGGASIALGSRVAPEVVAPLWRVVQPWLGQVTAAPWMVVPVFVAGGLLNLPVAALLIACGAVYGPVDGMGLGLAGAAASGLAGFLVGRLAGRDLVRRLAGRRMTHVLRAIPRHGVLVVALLRLVPAASFAIVNLVAGAARMRLANYLLGTVIGMVPVTAALAAFGDRLAAVARRGEGGDLALMCLFILVLVVAENAMARRLTRGAPGPQQPGPRQVGRQQGRRRV